MRKILFLLFLAGTLIMVYIMSKTGAPLKTTLTPHGIINLELAGNADSTNAILKAWAPVGGTNNIAVAERNTWLDFIFIFFYSGFLFLMANKIRRSFAGGFGKAGKYIARGALLAGFFDILENVGMLTSLSGKGAATVSLFTASCSMMKWGLLLVVGLYIFTGMMASLRVWISNRR